MANNIFVTHRLVIEMKLSYTYKYTDCKLREIERYQKQLLNKRNKYKLWDSMEEKKLYYEKNYFGK